jgi:hypothetical protein
LPADVCRPVSVLLLRTVLLLRMVGSCSGRVLLKLYRRTVACGRLRSCGRSCSGWLAAAPDGCAPAVGWLCSCGRSCSGWLAAAPDGCAPAVGWLCSCGRSCSGWLAAAPDGVIEAVPSDGCLRTVALLCRSCSGWLPAVGWQLLRSDVQILDIAIKSNLLQ